MTSKKQPLKNSFLFIPLSFFEKALDVIKPPHMKLLTVFIVAVLSIAFLQKECANYTLRLVLVVVVVLVFACLSAFLQYAEMRFRYSLRTQEELKKALREEIMEKLRKEKMARDDY